MLCQSSLTLADNKSFPSLYKRLSTIEKSCFINHHIPTTFGCHGYVWICFRSFFYLHNGISNISLKCYITKYSHWYTSGSKFTFFLLSRLYNYSIIYMSLAWLVINGVTSEGSAVLGLRKLGAWSAVSVGRLTLVEGGAVRSPGPPVSISAMLANLTCLVLLRKL